MGSAGFFVSGIDHIVRELERRERAVEQGTADGVNETALMVQGDAKRGAPVDTGRLRSSIKLDPASADLPVARVEATAEYASHVEYGTMNQSAQPFMEPALARNLPSLKPNIEKHVRRRIG